MSARVLILIQIGALLAISHWLPGRALRDIGRETVSQRAHPTQVCLQTARDGHSKLSIDSCSQLWEISDPAFCTDENEQDEEESPNTIALPPHCGQSDWPSVKGTGLARSLEGTAPPFGPIRLRC